MTPQELPALKASRGQRLAVLTTAFVVSFASAQTVPKDEPLELSPFVVNEGKNAGWVATETLAGSRLRTNFKDVPNQIEALTKEFMDDLAVNSLDAAAIYTTNTENLSDYSPNSAEGTLNSPNNGARVRGLVAGTNSRNFFRGVLASDNYNLDRATIASGPNAILFGLGSPAGILDTSPARALMRDRYGFSLQLDSENSRRATFDANRVVLKDVLALRLMGLSQRRFTDKKPNLDRDDRAYLAVTYKPTKHTTIVLQGERVSRNLRGAVRMPPRDYVSLWNNAALIPGSGYSSPRPVYDNSNFATIAGNAIFAREADIPVLVSGSQAMRGFRNSVVVKNPSTLPGTNQAFDADIEHTVNDPAIFPLDRNIFGTRRTGLLGGNLKTAVIEQRLAPDLFLELAYNYEKAYSKRLGIRTGDVNELYVDANRYLPGTTTPNPHLGKLYVQGPAVNDIEGDENSAWRATLSYELDLVGKLGRRSAWARWLGRHRFSGLYSGEVRQNVEGSNYPRRILDDPVLEGVALRPRTFQNWANHSTRSPQFREYLDGPGASASYPGPGSLEGEWIVNDSRGNPFSLRQYDTGLVSATSGKRLAGGQVASGTRHKEDSLVFAWQGFFLPNRERQPRLLLTYGYRQDHARVARFDEASTAQDFSGLYPIVWDATFGDYGRKQSGVNRNLGVIARPLPWLSLFYNHSSSFNLNVGRYDPFGNEYSGAGGDGRDAGVRLDLWRDKLSLRLNRYENTLGPQRANNQINGFRTPIWNVESRVRELDPGIATINVTDGNLRGFRNAGQPNYWIMSDFRSEGYELELNFSPTPDWNIRLNGSKSEVMETNIGQEWFDYVRQREPVWKSVVARNGEVDRTGAPVGWATADRSANNPTGQTLGQYYETEVVGRGLAFMTAVDGRATDTARPARANLVTSYRFREGRLKGFNLGGAARWRSAPTIGYGVKPGPAGDPIMDLDRAFRGKEEIYLDAFFGYRARTKLFGGFSYRVQMNIRNVLDEAGAIPVTATTTGQVVRIATVDPRLFVWTFGVDF